MYEKKIPVLDYELNCQFIRPTQIDDEKTVLIFIHEALGSIPQWRDFPLELCKKLGLEGIVYERQGHGKSDPFKQKRTARFLHEAAYFELHGLIQTLISPDKKIILVGHSDGGSIALLYASKFPQAISAVISMAAHVINEPETRAGILPAIEAFKMGKLDGLKKYHGEKTEKLFYAWANIWQDSSFLDWDIQQDIQGIKAPCLVIQGKEDQYGTIKQLELIQKNVPQAKTTFLAHCKHHPHLEMKAELLSEIVLFLEK